MMMRTSLILLICFAACAPDLRIDHPFDGTGKCIDPVSKAEVDCALIPLVSVSLDGAVRNMIVDATNKESKVYVDLDSGREMKTDEAFARAAHVTKISLHNQRLNAMALEPRCSREKAVGEP